MTHHPLPYPLFSVIGISGSRTDRTRREYVGRRAIGHAKRRKKKLCCPPVTMTAMTAMTTPLLVQRPSYYARRLVPGCVRRGLRMLPRLSKPTTMVVVLLLPLPQPPPSLWMQDLYVARRGRRHVGF
jgi:hypothetical protein